MSRVAVVTDSSFYAPADLAEASDIHVVSLYVQEGDRQYREVDIDDFGAFYERLRVGADRTTTSQPSIGDFLAVYEPLLEAGRDIVSVHLAGGISGTVECARQAAEDAERRHPGRRIAVVDSTNGCGALGYVALAAGAVAGAGGDVDAVVARTGEAIDSVRLWFAIDTLEYLRRGGRIGAAQAWLGGALKIKPILTLTNEITPVERVRTSARAFERLLDFLRQQQADGSDGWIIQHVQAADVALRLADAGYEIFGRPPLFVNEIGPVIGAHVGPGLLGVGGGPANLLEP